MTNMQLIVFNLEEQHYGVEIDYVNGINKVKDFKIIKIPNCPDYIEGMINLRGKVIPLYNLRKRFFNQDSICQDNEILIVFMRNTLVGLIVDEVFDIIKLEEEDIESAVNLFTNVDGRFIDSIGKKDDNMIIILDVKSILSLVEQQVPPDSLEE
ncbi:purine-binding chemotaxis protein CheW [Natronincola peptidivorans]|uniref:Purine-binding chemotaxis protein CheW n=1 Tax=Natronincola peptidivorans TaxID=426128 RepID=A0A1I0HHM1_9FIRM|nr:chemotaxis protein CheW [Natronincola peptidivorans]SET83201.1 purine-binding chemotaxis protein CheW [Natronincola peptidivorans]